MVNKKGVVLVTVLWILLLLSLIIWSLSRRSSVEISLMETYQGKLCSYAAARAGINKMIDLIQRHPSAKDTLYATAISLDTNQTPSDVFAHIPVGEAAYVNVGWTARNFNTIQQAPQLEYGIMDEGGRININAINTSNYQILSALLQLKGLTSSDADKLALSIVHYIRAEAMPGQKPKNRPYQNILELLEVDGMTQGIFDSIQDDITVYGDSQNGLWINTNTANNDVIQALAHAVARFNPAINADAITTQAYAIRDGGDGQSFTSDDGTFNVSSMANPSWPSALHFGKSNYYRIRAIGVDSRSLTRSIIEAVVHYRPAKSDIIFWRRIS